MRRSRPEPSRSPEAAIRESPIQRWQRGDALFAAHDCLAVEEPLEIRVNGNPVAVTMRTPGHDRELAAGFLFTEDVLPDASALASLRVAGNVAEAALTPGASLDFERLRRNVFISSSCGVCGKASAEAVFQACPTLLPGPYLAPETIAALPEALRAAQAAFSQTGGLHAAALFSPDGAPISLFEDVGRHNALDKLLGDAFLRESLPLSRAILLVSGRASFELVQKAAMAGVGVLVAIGAPSSLAVETAERVGMTLVGFAKPERFNIYAHPERIQTSG